MQRPNFRSCGRFLVTNNANRTRCRDSLFVLPLAMEIPVTAPALDILYVADALPTADADLAYLTAEVDWIDRMHARQTASFGSPYNYSGQQYPACAMPSIIAAIGDHAATLAGHPFNNCLCNRYENGSNTMGFHSDSYDGLVASSRIAIASFGASRKLVFRSIDKLHRSELVLEHGSILLMTRTTQLAWTHAILRDATADRRISATFRLFTECLPPHVRESPRDACPAQGGAGATRPQHDPDDEALRSPRTRGHA